MKALQEVLAPINFPDLEIWNSDKWPWLGVYYSAIHIVKIPDNTWRGPDGNVYIWDDKESRLWFFGQKEAFVSYFTFEYGKPFCFIKESLLVTRKGNSFDWDVLAKHLMMSLQYPIPASGELLPADGPYPAILGELSKKKLLPKGAEKFARHIFDQFTMEKLGFKQPTMSRYDILSVLVEATSNYNFSTISKLHPILWSMIAVPGLLTQTNEEKLDQKKDGIQEVQQDFEIISVGSAVSKNDLHGEFCKPREGWDQVGDYYIRETDGSVSRETVVLENEKADEEGGKENK